MVPSLLLTNKALGAGRFDRCHFCDALTFCTINADRFGKATCTLWPHHGDQTNRSVLDANNTCYEPITRRALWLESNYSLCRSPAPTFNCSGGRELRKAPWCGGNNNINRLALNTIFGHDFCITSRALWRNSGHLLYRGSSNAGKSSCWVHPHCHFDRWS